MTCSADSREIDKVDNTERSSVKVMEEDGGADEHKDLNDPGRNVEDVTVLDKKARCHIAQVLDSSFRICSHVNMLHKFCILSSLNFFHRVGSYLGESLFCCWSPSQ